MSNQWYYSEDGAQYGPVDEAVIVRLIQDGELPIGTPVLQEGHMDWQPARDHACFQVEIYPKKKRPPVQVTASTASKPASGGTSPSPRQAGTPPIIAPSIPVVPPTARGALPSAGQTAVCVVYSIVWFFLLMVFPILIPKFKTIFTDMLGEGEGLPEFTELVLAISDAIQNNALITLPLGLLLCLGFAYFMGFKERFLEKNLCKIINKLSILLYLVFLLGVIIAMFLPLIKMMDKLGQ
jgi:hypothetical protein